MLLLALPGRAWQAPRMEPVIFARNSDIEPTLVTSVDGIPTTGEARLRKLLHGPLGLLVEVRYKAGMKAPTHAHDHESYCYCVSGKIKSIVDGVEYILGPGDAVFHPTGVPHSTEVLEDSIWIEAKTPAKQTW